jgi:hypothetical protein
MTSQNVILYRENVSYVVWQSDVVDGMEESDFTIRCMFEAELRELAHVIRKAVAEYKRAPLHKV